MKCVSSEKRSPQDNEDLPELAQYVANSLTIAAERPAWPRSDAAAACQLLMRDLGEFASVMIAAGRAGMWSAEQALERLFIERAQALMGASIDDAFAKRYLKTVMEPPKPDKPLKPATRARAEDAFTVLARDGGMSKEDARNFRDAFRKIMDPKSDWFVHPTAIGPSLSLNVANGREEAGKIWGQMANHLQFACVFSLLACVRIGVITSKNRAESCFVIGPGSPSATSRRSTSMTGVRCAAVPVMNTSSAM